MKKMLGMALVLLGSMQHMSAMDVGLTAADVWKMVWSNTEDGSAEVNPKLVEEFKDPFRVCKTSVDELARGVANIFDTDPNNETIKRWCSDIKEAADGATDGYDSKSLINKEDSEELVGNFKMYWFTLVAVPKNDVGEKGDLLRIQEIEEALPRRSARLAAKKKLADDAVGNTAIKKKKTRK